MNLPITPTNALRIVFQRVGQDKKKPPNWGGFLRHSSQRIDFFLALWGSVILRRSIAY